MTEAIVHIGFNKCGSTALQAWLADNQAELSRLGFAWRRTDPRPEVICANPQFRDLAFSLAGMVAPDRPFTKVAGYRQGDLAAQTEYTARFSDGFDTWLRGAGTRTVLISNEALGAHLRRPETVSALDGWLRERFDAVSYIAYIRHPVPWTVSHWAQVRRGTGKDLPFSEFSRKHGLTSFARALPVWAEVVGTGRLRLRLYHECWRIGNGLADDFCRSCGIPQSGRLRRIARRNPTRFEKPWHRWFPALRNLRRGGVVRRPDPDLLRRVAQANARQMAWIGETFFPGDAAYRDWLAQDHASLEVKV